MKLINQKNGYSLVETLVAITILMLAISGPLTIASKGLQTAQFAKDQTQAFLLAQEGLEFVNAIRNEAIIAGVKNSDLSTVWDWVNNANLAPCFINNSSSPFASNGNNGCNVDFSDSSLFNNVQACPAAGCTIDYTTSGNQRAPFQRDDGSANNDTKYNRLVTIEHLSDNELQVISTVSWYASIFSSADQVSLTTAVFKLYETP